MRDSSSIVVLVILVLVVWADIAKAENSLAEKNDGPYAWRAIAGLQAVQQSSRLHYKPKYKDSNLVVDVDDIGGDKLATSFSYFSLERKIGKSSRLDLSYTKDDVTAMLMAKQKIRFFFFSLHTTVQVPLDIELKTLRLRYSKTLYQSGGFRCGASGAVQCLHFSGSANLPFTGYDHEEYLTVLPCIGAYAEYQASAPVLCSIRTDYLPLLWGNCSGSIKDLEARVEYRVSPRCSAGVGYRYSAKEISLKRDDYDAYALYAVRGALLYVGYAF
jgi:hypothetical protein